jgi:hypothetical protein
MREALLRCLSEFRAAGLPIVHALGGEVHALGSGVRALGGGVSPAGDQAFPGLDRGFLPRPEAPLYGQWLIRGRLQRLGPGEVVLHKPGWGAFWQTPLEGYLRATGAETLAVAGCGFPCGPRATLYEASERLFRTVLLDGAVSGLYALARAELAGLGVSLRREPGAPLM